MKVKSESEISQSCPTLRDPMDCSLSGSSVHGIFQAKITLAATNSRKKEAEDRISEVEDRMIEINESERKKK